MKLNLPRKHDMEPEESKNQEKVRSSIKPLAIEQRLVNPFSLFKIFMTGMMREGESSISPAFSSLNYFKIIHEVSYDKKSKVVRAYLENDPGLSQISWEEIVDRLQSNGEPHTAEWSKVLESFLGIFDDLKKISHNFALSGNKIISPTPREEWNKLRNNLMKNGLTIFLHFTLSESDPTICEFNDKLIAHLGYNPNQFASDVLNYGLPEIYPNAKRKYAEVLRELGNIIMQENYDGSPFSVDKMELLHADFSTSFAKESVYSYREMNDSNLLELEIIMTYELLSSPPLDKKKTMISEFTSIARSLPTKTYYDKEREEFLARYYNVKKEDPKDQARTCRIRFLDQNNE